jgi:hypothetical protein
VGAATAVHASDSVTIKVAIFVALILLDLGSALSVPATFWTGWKITFSCSESAHATPREPEFLGASREFASS